MKINIRVVYQFDPSVDDYVKVEEESYEYEGPVAMAGGGGDDVTTTTTSQPPAFQQPFIEDVLNQAQGQYQAPGPFFYPGSAVADINPLQTQSFAGALDFADTGARDIANLSAQGYATGIGAANPLQNPFFHDTVNAIINPVTKQLTQQVLPQIDAGAVQSGQYGGSRQGVAQGQAIDAYQQNVLDSVSKFGSNAYGQGLDSLTRTLGLTPAVTQAQLTPSQIPGQVGDALQQYQQQLINSDIQRFNFGQAQPVQSLQNYAGLVGNPLGTSQTQVQPGASGSNLTSGLGGAALGLAANSAISGSAAMSAALPFAATMPWLLPLIGAGVAIAA